LPSPAISFKQVATVFGNLALAYGAGIVVPALQREHSDPARMPRIIVVTLTFVSVCFMAVAITGVSVVGCQIPGNLLFAIAGTKLGFVASRGGVVFAFLFMQMHVTIAFSVIIFPAFYTLERLVLGIHKTAPLVAGTSVPELEAPVFGDMDTPMMMKDVTKGNGEHHDMDTQTYKAPGVYPKVAALRIVVIAACVVVATLWEDRLLDLLDFTGASCIALCCMILPIVFYLKHFGSQVSWPERIWAVFAVVVSLALGAYVTYESAGPLFNPPPASTGVPPWNAPKFPYCTGSYVNIVYTNTSYHQSFATNPLRF
ncbi:hypothetical protein As57867_009369, partial [Aphanomyces stellatus]